MGKSKLATREQVIVMTKWCLSQDTNTGLKPKKQCDAPYLQKNRQIFYYRLNKRRISI